MNCAARVGVRNAGRAAVETPGHAGTGPRLLPRVEWDPPRPREDGLSCWVSGGAVVLRPGEEASAAAFTHLPEGAGTEGGLDRIRLRVVLEAYRPAPWRVGLSEWMLRQVDLGPRLNDWMLGLLEREPRLVESPWFEADVPDASSLAAAAAAAAAAP